MTDQPKSIWQREVLPEIFIFRWPRRFLRWLFSWRGVRRILIVLAWTITIVALVYGEENWRGRQAWNSYRRQLEASGAQLNFSAFIPAPVPDDQNFAAIPFLKAWFTDRTNSYLFDKDAFSRVDGAISGYDTDKDEGNRRFMDLVAWGMAFDAIRDGPLPKEDRQFRSDKSDSASRAQAAPVVLAGLKDDDQVFAELRQAASRPRSRYFIYYDLDDPWGILLPHLARVKATCMRLQLKACAELALGQSDQALQDVNLSLHMADSVKEEPIVISCLVRWACVRIAVQPVWEGLAEHRWTDAQLQELQRRFQEFDFVSDLNQAFAAERAAGVLTAELLARNKYALSQLSGGSGANGFERLAQRLAPSGWWALEQLNYCRLFQVQMEGVSDPARKRIIPARVQANHREFDREFGSRNPFTVIVTRHQLLSVLLLPALGNFSERAARGQACVDQTVIACALERYRLANGRFPESLQELAPRFIAQLPNDVITGEPWRYRRTADGQFILYSVGWNEKDDGGTISLRKDRAMDWRNGDWVW